jgi:hypothetical protein
MFPNTLDDVLLWKEIVLSEKRQRACTPWDMLSFSLSTSIASQTQKLLFKCTEVRLFDVISPRSPLKLSLCSKWTEIFFAITSAFIDQINPSSFGPLLLSSFLLLGDGVQKTSAWQERR